MVRELKVQKVKNGPCTKAILPSNISTLKMFSKNYKLLFLKNETSIVDINFTEQLSSFQFLILFLKVFKSSILLFSSSTISYISSPKNEKPVPLWYSDITGDLENLEICTESYGLLSFCFKVSFRKSGDRFLLTRSISIARFWMLLMWIETEKSSLQ